MSRLFRLLPCYAEILVWLAGMSGKKKREKNGYLSSPLISLNIVVISGLPLLLGGKWIK